MSCVTELSLQMSRLLFGLIFILQCLVIGKLNYYSLVSKFTFFFYSITKNKCSS